MKRQTLTEPKPVKLADPAIVAAMGADLCAVTCGRCGGASPLAASFDLPPDNYRCVHCGLRWRVVTVGEWGEPFISRETGQLIRRPPDRRIELLLL